MEPFQKSVRRANALLKEQGYTPLTDTGESLGVVRHGVWEWVWGKTLEDGEAYAVLTAQQDETRFFRGGYDLQFWVGRETPERYGRALLAELAGLLTFADDDEAWQQTVSSILVEAGSAAEAFPQEMLTGSRIFESRRRSED